MASSPTNTFNRSDTLLGVCAAIGQDFRINPVVPRLAFAGLLFWHLWAAVAIYLALGTVILLSRLVFSSRMATTPAIAAPVPAVGSNDDTIELARAA